MLLAAHVQHRQYVKIRASTKPSFQPACVLLSWVADALLHEEVEMFSLVQSSSLYKVCWETEQM